MLNFLLSLQVAVFDMPQPRVAVSGNVLPFKRAASAPDAAAAAAAAAGSTAAAASSPWAAVQSSVQSSAQSPAPAKPPGSPSRAIPSLGPRPAFLQVLMLTALTQSITPGHRAVVGTCCAAVKCASCLLQRAQLVSTPGAMLAGHVLQFTGTALMR